MSPVKSFQRLTIQGISTLLSAFLVAHHCPVFSQELGVMFGVRQDSADSNMAGYNVNSLTSVAFGLWAMLLFQDKFSLRSGMHYVPRSYRLGDNQAYTDFRLSYFEIPVGLMYRLADAGGVFVGTALSLNLDLDCGVYNNQCQPTSPYLPIQIGASFKFAPQLGAEVFYETAGSKITDQIRNPRAVGVNLFFYVE